MRRREALTLGFGGAVGFAGAPGWAQDAAPEVISPLWRRRVPEAVTVSLSPDGSRVLSVNRAGEVQAYQRDGTDDWQQSLPGADTFVHSQDGSMVLAYARRRPTHPQLTWLDRSGRVVTSFAAPAEIELAALSSDGRVAAVSCRGEVLMLIRSGKDVRVRHLGALRPAQIRTAPLSSFYLVCPHRERLLRVRADGKEIWGHPLRQSESLATSGDGSRLAVAYQTASDVLQVDVLDQQGALVCRFNRPGRRARLRLSAAGNAVLMEYEHAISHLKDHHYERRLAYRDCHSTMEWTKGGAYTVPVGVAVGRDGHWVLALETIHSIGIPRFRLFGRSGERLWLHTGSSHVVLAASSRDGDHVALYHSDSMLELLRVSAV